MTELAFGVDVDAVVADTVSAILHRINTQFALGLRLDDVTEYYVDKWLEDRQHLAEVRTRLLYENEFYSALPAMAGAVEAVRVLADQGPCYFITARPDEFQSVTAAWLTRQGFPADIPVLCTWEKPAAARELGLTHFAEDSDVQAERLAAAGLDVFLFDYPWNRHVVCDAPGYATDGGQREGRGRVLRVRGWHEVLAHLGLPR